MLLHSPAEPKNTLQNPSTYSGRAHSVHIELRPIIEENGLVGGYLLVQLAASQPALVEVCPQDRPRI